MYLHCYTLYIQGYILFIQYRYIYIIFIHLLYNIYILYNNVGDLMVNFHDNRSFKATDASFFLFDEFHMDVCGDNK